MNNNTMTVRDHWILALGFGWLSGLAIGAVSLWFAFGPLGSDELPSPQWHQIYTVVQADGTFSDRTADQLTLDQQWREALSRPKVGPFVPNYLFRYPVYWEPFGRQQRNAVFYYVVGPANKRLPKVGDTK